MSKAAAGIFNLSFAYTRKGENWQEPAVPYKNFLDYILCTDVADHMTPGQRMIAASNIVAAVKQDALAKGLLVSLENRDARKLDDFYETENLAIWRLRKDCRYSVGMYDRIREIGNYVSDVVSSQFYDAPGYFPFLPTDFKIEVAIEVSMNFNDAARQLISPALAVPLLGNFDFSRRYLGGAVSNFVDWSNGVEAAGIKGPLEQPLIDISTAAIQTLDPVKYTSVVVHECVHDMFNQFLFNASNGVTFPLADDELRNDFVLAFAYRSGDKPATYFDRAYLLDPEEDLCRHAQWAVEDTLLRLLPGHQLACKI